MKPAGGSAISASVRATLCECVNVRLIELRLIVRVTKADEDSPHRLSFVHRQPR
jgi:hypothetical protein